MVRVFLFILNPLFVCLFVCSFLHFLKRVTIQIRDETCQKLLPAVVNSCHIMFIIVYSSFIILNYGLLYLLNFMY